MMSQDVFVEVSHGPTLIDNNIMLSRAYPAPGRSGRGLRA